MTFTKIFVALDQSPQTAEIFEKALQLAQQYGASLMLFHGIDWDYAGGLAYFNAIEGDLDFSGAIAEVEQQKLEEEINNLKKWLEDYKQKAEEKEVETKLSWKIGNPSRIILDLAKEWGADLIVIGRRGRSGLSEILLGSVSNYVLHNASCSVLVVQHD